MSKIRTVKMVFVDHETANSFFEWWVKRGADAFHNGHYEQTQRIPAQPVVSHGEHRYGS
jgi:hypothetical protein